MVAAFHSKETHQHGEETSDTRGKSAQLFIQQRSHIQHIINTSKHLVSTEPKIISYLVTRATKYRIRNSADWGAGCNPSTWTLKWEGRKLDVCLEFQVPWASEWLQRQLGQISENLSQSWSGLGLQHSTSHGREGLGLTLSLEIKQKI